MSSCRPLAIAHARRFALGAMLQLLLAVGDRVQRTPGFAGAASKIRRTHHTVAPAQADARWLQAGAFQFWQCSAWTTASCATTSASAVVKASRSSLPQASAIATAAVPNSSSL